MVETIGCNGEEAEYSYLVVTKSYEAINQEVEERSQRRVLTGFVAALCAVGYPPVFIDKWDAVGCKIMDKIGGPPPFVYSRHAPNTEYRNALIEALPKVVSRPVAR